METGDKDDIAGSSQRSDRSFITSLGDDELIEFINKLSQRKRKTSKSDLEEPETSLETSIPLAQPKPIEPESTASGDGVGDESDDGDQNKNVIFGDYATYFAHKSKEQQKQDEEYLKWEHQRQLAQGNEVKTSDIFKNCVIHVNGHTKPGISTLHKLIVLNGGKFLHHLGAKGNATHIIASRITPRKQVEFKNYKVVKPEWVVDSVENGKLKKWSDYSVINVDYGQKRLPYQLRNDDDEGGNDDDEEDKDEDEDDNYKKLSQLVHKEEKQVNDLNITIDSKHPDFLKTFFARSRLHHLSTWKNELRSDFLKLALNIKPKTHKKNKLIVHVDFDCFFATVSSLKNPSIDFANKPVCVSHGGANLNSTADIASCNYECRKFGIKNGMWMSSALKLCPDLIVLDYDFDSYERVSKQFYDILIGLKPDSLFPVSIDEALLDITSLIDEDDLIDEGDLIDRVNRFSTNLRNEVFEKTKCSVSVGVSTNVLLAKLSLRKAKPDGAFFLFDKTDEFLKNVNIRDLPGVGYSIESKLRERLKVEVIKIEQLRTLEIDELEKLFGIKTAKRLYDYARGIDNTSIDISQNPQDFLRKSVSIDINWGIRFSTIEQIDTFLLDLSKELMNKLNKLEMATTQLVLKILKRAQDAPIDPPKYLGCGHCDSFSKSSRLGVPTDDFRILGTEARSMFRHIGCDPLELRGVSLQAQKLVAKSDVNQTRLPFAKVSFDVFAKELQKKKPPSITNENNKKSTQFDVPSDIDSSVLDELPSTLKKDIRIQHEKNQLDINELPKEIDSEVFNSLPRSIQEELKEELRRRNIKITPQTPTKNKKVYFQKLFPQDGAAEFIRIKSPPKRSPTKKPQSPRKVQSRSPTKSPVKIEKYDEEVLKELPSSIRKSIIKEWETYESINETKASKIRNNYQVIDEEPINAFLTMHHFHQLHKPLIFQKKTRPKEILKLIEKWILHTKQKGPHSKDLEIFKKYLSELIDQNKVLYLLILESIELLLNTEEICEKWKIIYQEIQ